MQPAWPAAVRLYHSAALPRWRREDGLATGAGAASGTTIRTGVARIRPRTPCGLQRWQLPWRRVGACGRCTGGSGRAGLATIHFGPGGPGPGGWTASGGGRGELRLTQQRRRCTLGAGVRLGEGGGRDWSHAPAHGLLRWWCWWASEGDRFPTRVRRPDPEAGPAPRRHPDPWVCGTAMRRGGRVSGRRHGQVGQAGAGPEWALSGSFWRPQRTGPAVMVAATAAAAQTVVALGRLAPKRVAQEGSDGLQGKVCCWFRWCACWC